MPISRIFSLPVVEMYENDCGVRSSLLLPVFPYHGGGEERRGVNDNTLLPVSCQWSLQIFYKYNESLTQLASHQLANINTEMLG